MIKKTLGVLVSVILLTGCSGTMINLGINEGRLQPCPKTPNCINSQSGTEGQKVQPINYTGAQKEAHERLLQIIKTEKRTKILTVHGNYIRVEFTSALFRFVDDVEFYFPEGQEGDGVIHVRSASRVGHSDLGANRKRIERIRSKFSK